MDTLSLHLDACPTCLEALSLLEGESDTVIELLEQESRHYRAEPRLHELTGALLGDPELSRWSAAEFGNAARPRLPRNIPDTVDEYRLTEPLGSGAVGRVYKAVHQKLHRTVALKLLAPKGELSRDLVERFRREMRAVGQIDHPNVVAATDAGEADGYHFLAMEYVPGLDVGQVVARLERLPVADACEIVRQAALGVQAAHDHGLVHRDLKPSNLLLTDRGRVKVLDLGLVALPSAGRGIKGRKGELTAKVVGTPHYMAPEQWQGRPADARTDVYSLGCTLFKLLTGRAPFEEEQPLGRHNLWRAHCHAAVPDASAEHPDIPRELAALASRALAKGPEERFATARELAEALAPWCAGVDLDAALVRARSLSLADTLHGGSSQTVTQASSLQPPHRHWRWWSVALCAGVVVSAAWAVSAALVPTKEKDGWQITLPVSDEPLWCEAGTDPVVELAVPGARPEMSLQTAGRTFLQTGEAGDETFALRTSVSLDPEERAGVFFGGHVEGTGLRTGFVEVRRRAEPPSEGQIEYIVSVRQLIHDVYSPDRVFSKNLDMRQRSDPIYIPATVTDPLVEVRVSPHRLSVLFEGQVAATVTRAGWIDKSAYLGKDAVSEWNGPFGAYVLTGNVEFSHIRFFDY